MEYYSAAEKEGNLTLWDSTDGPGKHYVKCNKPEKDKYHMMPLVRGI